GGPALGGLPAVLGGSRGPALERDGRPVPPRLVGLVAGPGRVARFGRGGGRGTGSRAGGWLRDRGERRTGTVGRTTDRQRGRDHGGGHRVPAAAGLLHVRQSPVVRRLFSRPSRRTSPSVGVRSDMRGCGRVAPSHRVGTWIWVITGRQCC